MRHTMPRYPTPISERKVNDGRSVIRSAVMGFSGGSRRRSRRRKSAKQSRKRSRRWGKKKSVVMYSPDRKVNDGRSMLRSVRMGFSESYTVYTKDGCPHCKSAVEYIKSKGLSVTPKRGEVYQDEIDIKLKKAGRSDFRTWPKVFAPDGSFIGGNQDLRNKL